jgi:hypothetical protein
MILERRDDLHRTPGAEGERFPRASWAALPEDGALRTLEPVSTVISGACVQVCTYRAVAEGEVGSATPS